MEQQIKRLLEQVVHPETGKDLVTSGFVEHIGAADGKATVVLRFAKSHDPFAVKIKNQVEALLREALPGTEVLVVVKEGGQPPRPEPKLKTATGAIARIIAVADYYDMIINPSAEFWAKTKKQAVRELFSASGLLFDPEVVKAFIETLG